MNLNHFFVYEYVYIRVLQHPILIKTLTKEQLGDLSTRQEYLDNRRTVIKILLDYAMTGLQDDDFVVVYVKHGDELNSWYIIEDGFLVYHSIDRNEHDIL